MFEFLCIGRFFPTYSKYSSLPHICHHFLSHYIHAMCVIPVSLFFGTNGCWSGETLLWDRLDDLAVQKDEEVGGVCAELTCGWSFGSCPHMAPEWNMRAPQSFLSIVSLCLQQDRSPWPPQPTRTELTLAFPSAVDSSSSRLCLPRSLHLLASSPTAFACARVPRLKEHVHVSSPVKVTPYGSCRDNEGFNFTTQAYQIAAPRSLRHALATWVIWMGRHPPFHVRRVVCTVKFAKRPHHHNCRLLQSGLQDWV